MIDRLSQGLADSGYLVTEKQARTLVDYYHLISQWNSHTNLTAITDFSDFIFKHVADSLVPMRHLDLEGARVADVGSGAGFPGIPLQILQEDINLTLLDSARKRTDFLSHCCRELGLRAKVMQARAEDAGQSPLRESFQFVLSRAVASLPVLCELCLPLVEQGGVFAAMKGPRAKEELHAAETVITLLGGSPARLIEYSLPRCDQRVLVIIEKTQPTPAKYPRKAGIPEKRPLA